MNAQRSRVTNGDYFWAYFVFHISDEEKSNLAIQVLPLLFPPGQAKRSKGAKHSRATISEACNSFIQAEEVRKHYLFIIYFRYKSIT
jgi:hypothetical protein